jgi:hypothetical protein
MPVALPVSRPRNHGNSDNGDEQNLEALPEILINIAMVRRPGHPRDESGRICWPATVAVVSSEWEVWQAATAVSSLMRACGGEKW